MIPGWRKSEGARKEFKKAAELGLTCLNSDWRIMTYLLRKCHIRKSLGTFEEFECRKMMFECEREMEFEKALLNDLKIL
jgi:hypothetical protein